MFLTGAPLFYYTQIRERYKNSYLAEDVNQVIIGIDCDYLDAYEYSYSSLEQYHHQQKAIAHFAGLFGVFSYETIHFFEQIPEKTQRQYDILSMVMSSSISIS